MDKVLETVTEFELALSNNRIERDVKGELFNVFSLCGVNHYELWHSRILAEFLNPQGTHGFSNGELLKSFFAMLSKKCPEKSCVFDLFDENTVVKTELPEKIGGESIGRFDIYLESWRNKAICIIENKIFIRDMTPAEVQEAIKLHGELPPGSSQYSYFSDLFADVEMM